MLRVPDRVRHGLRAAIPEPTEGQHIAAFIFARTEFVNVHR